jgi:2-oxoglutarate dehydrogenase E2 component (dihydrolipoamide succinyltransferase)
MIMTHVNLVLPAMGEGIIEAVITRWLVREGDFVEEDQALVEIATDKVDSEIPSPASGTVSRILIPEGGVPSVGDILAVIETSSELQVQPDEDSVAVQAKAPAAGKKNMVTKKVITENVQEIPRQTPSGKFLTPLVRNIAKKEKITLDELDSISGSGDGGRINKNDILSFIAKRGKKNNASRDTAVTDPAAAPEPEVTAPSEGDELIEMDRVRKLISSRMVDSKRISAHVTSFIDADVTEMVRWREANKEAFRKRENQNITYTAFFIEAIAKALRDYPLLNVSVDGTTIIVKKNINIGIAVALPGGNLIVPVIKNADEKSLTGLAKAVNDLAFRARNNKLTADELSGGTFTLTNFGTFANTTGTPIINQPEVAILGTGAIIKKPVVLETTGGDVIAIRNIMTLSLSYDHRVVDGALGGMFLRSIAGYLENFDPQGKI